MVCYALRCLLLLFAGVPAVVALETARMQLPTEFEQRATRVSAEGFGGRNKGSYTIGDYHGKFTRSESRLGIRDPLYVSSKGKSSFTFQQQAHAEPLESECRMTKGAVTVGIVTFDPKKMSYRCEFRRGGTLQPASFVMGQPKRDGVKQRFLATDLRSGESVIGSEQLMFESVHSYKGSPLSSQVPVGYLIRSGETVVGAVELTDWNPTLYLADDLADASREALLVTALAISVLRDPADSALED